MIGRLKAILVRLKKASFQAPVLGLLLRAAVSSVREHSKDQAASIAYFGIVSLFPLLLGLVALASSVLRSERLRLQVLQWVNEFFPVGADFVTQNIESLIRLRGAAGIVSILVLFWSASKMVGAISRGVNQALGLERPHAAILSPLRNFGLTLTISLLMFATVAISPIADLLSNLESELLGPGASAFIGVIGGRLVSLMTTGAMFAVTYILVSFHRPAWADLLPGLLTATLLMELGKMAFVYYVDSSKNLDVLYGSISSFIVLLLWLYFFGRVMLYGAAVIRVHREDRFGMPADPDSAHDQA